MAKEEFCKLGFSSEEDYKRIRGQTVVLEGKKEGTSTGWKHVLRYK